MTSDNSTKDDAARQAAVAMLAEGSASLSEAARLAGVDRQLVLYWAKTAKINWRKARNSYLVKAWRRALKR